MYSCSGAGIYMENVWHAQNTVITQLPSPPWVTTPGSITDSVSRLGVKKLLKP